jgi:Fe-S-cluster containining protein
VLGGETLAGRYPPSPPCACETCLAYCQRPGWWTVEEAAAAISAGYASRMMLEMSPDRRFGVLSPAFAGNEVDFALGRCKHRGCTFLREGRCELHGSGLQPLECRFCHHDRPGQGPACHAAIERDWDSDAGRALVTKWARLTGFWERLGLPAKARPR